MLCGPFELPATGKTRYEQRALQSTGPRLVSTPMQMKFSLLAPLLGLLAALPAHAQTDTQSESVKAWKMRLTAHIASNRLFPAEGRGQAGEAKVTFVIDRYGRLVSRTLAVSAGSRPLDLAALEIVARAQPFPGPPSELKEDTFSFTVPIVFNGRRSEV